MPLIDPTDLLSYTIVEKRQIESSNTVTVPPNTIGSLPNPQNPTGPTQNITVPGYSYNELQITEVPILVTGYINRNNVVGATVSIDDTTGTIVPSRTDLKMSDGNLVTVVETLANVITDLTT